MFKLGFVTEAEINLPLIKVAPQTRREVKMISELGKSRDIMERTRAMNDWVNRRPGHDWTWCPQRGYSQYRDFLKASELNHYHLKWLGDYITRGKQRTEWYDIDPVLTLVIAEMLYDTESSRLEQISGLDYYHETPTYLLPSRHLYKKIVPF